MNQHSGDISPFNPKHPSSKQNIQWQGLKGSGRGLAIAQYALAQTSPVVVITEDVHAAEQLEREVNFYLAECENCPVLIFPDRETLAYDVFSPHQDIISERLNALYHLPTLTRGILIVPITTLLHRMPPQSYIQAASLVMDCGEKIDVNGLRERLDKNGYHNVTQVMEHGEYALRGSIIDLYPMGSELPFRIDLFDDEIDSIRSFDPETQRSISNVEHIKLLPAREFALDEAGINTFRTAYRSHFEGNPQDSMIYTEVSKGNAPAGIEYYLPLFFEQTETLFEYFPKASTIIHLGDIGLTCARVWDEINHRYEQLRHNTDRPILAPDQVFIAPKQFAEQTNQRACIHINDAELSGLANSYHYVSNIPDDFHLASSSQQPLAALLNFIDQFEGRVLLVAETSGRREVILDLFRAASRHIPQFDHWAAFLEARDTLGITVAELESGLVIEQPMMAVITESQLFSHQIMQRRRRKKRERDFDSIIRDLTELNIGAPVVHEEHGVGRFLGLQTLDTGDITTEYLTLEYAGGDKLYVPVSSLQLIGRYTGASDEKAPLHKLGNEQWSKAKKKAAEKAHDVAVELLDIYSRREVQSGFIFPNVDSSYTTFANDFPFEETPDQLQAINSVIEDMTSEKTMDRVVCGDVGFGKTEVAMRAAFVAVQGNKQVAVLVPTTLLAQQHYNNFVDRFADMPVRIELLSRFRTGKALANTLDSISTGKADIVIGTHKLIHSDINFKDLGLVIIDEEHRFGVKQKERFKSLRSEVDMLTLTATPIPRTLNLALSGLRDLSIIATPPLKRLAIKTFTNTWNDDTIREACLREINRGGQVYILHNAIKNIDKITQDIEKLVPEARVCFAHGQMREKELESIMQDFYHQRFNVLVCSTIIESGIDIPNANTIIINRADKLGLAQLYQLRGRVGRSHHQAYAYLITPPEKTMSADARKRLDAISGIQDLGAGFTLATHDLEIRGAGELLGDEQSGQIMEIGFTMYTELLERAVSALKSGNQPLLDQPLQMDAEIDLRVPTLLPDDYLPDVHTRLVMYKRIANVENTEQLRDIQVEMIDRFGLLPEPAKNLMAVTELKFKARPLGIRKIEAGAQGGRIIFSETPNIDTGQLILLVQTTTRKYRFDGTDKVRFTHEMPDMEDRIHFIERFLEKIAPSD